MRQFRAFRNGRVSHSDNSISPSNKLLGNAYLDSMRSPQLKEIAPLR